MEDAHIPNQSWTSCCFKMDSHAALFFAQLIISLICISFSCCQLAQGNSESTYVALITFILGVWLPSPTSGKIAK